MVRLRSELTRFGARVSAYLALLTDRYPSTVDEQSVHLEIEYPDVERDLNRWLPLVKWLLAIPHYFVLLFLWIGALVAIVIAWFAILITGRYPKPLFDYRGRRQPVDPARYGVRVPAGHRPLSAVQPQGRILAMADARAPRAKARLDTFRKTALVAGILYLVTFASSIPAVFLQDPVLTSPDYILGGGADGQVRLGALLDIVNCLAAIGTAVALYSVVRRQHEGFAIGFVASRVFEAAILFIGIVNVLAIVTLRETAATAADPGSYVASGSRWSPSVTGPSCWVQACLPSMQPCSAG